MVQHHNGDRVRWNSHGSAGEGTVEEMITSDTRQERRRGRAKPAR
jgi:Hypervirulence associated proteins TUDOR domain